MHHPTDRIAHTTAFVTPVVEHWLEQEIAQWVKCKGVMELGSSEGARCSSIVEHLLVVWWLFGSISHGGPIEPFHIPASCSMTGVTKAVVCAILFGLVVIEQPLLLIIKSC